MRLPIIRGYGMIRGFIKRVFSLFCACVLCILSLTIGMIHAQAEEVVNKGVDFSISASMDPTAAGQQPDMFLRGLAKALEALTLKGHMILQDGQADISGDVMLNGLSAVDFHLSGWEERMSLQTSLFGEKPVLLTLANYMPYLLKVYDYFGMPVQYFGVFTDLYSYKYGIMPFVQKWNDLTGGTQSRSYTPKECIAIAEQLSAALEQDENQAFYQWRRGLLLYVTLDELINEFIYSLPDWMTVVTENGGLTIDITSEGESWTLGEETVYTIKREDDRSAWQVNLPEWEGYELAGNGVFGETDAGLNVDMEWNLFESGTPYGFAKVKATGLPDGKQLQGNSKIIVSVGGEGLGLEKTFMLTLAWNQREQNGKTMLDCQLEYLNPETEKSLLKVNASITIADTQENFEPRTAENIIGIDFFCMNDITIKEFFHDAKSSLVRSAIPFIVELPAGLWNGMFDWMDQNGILLMVMESLKGSASSN